MIMQHEDFLELDFKDKIISLYGKNNKLNDKKLHSYKGGKLQGKVNVPALLDLHSGMETEESLCYMNEFIKIIKLYLNTLDNNKVYKLLPSVKGQSSFSDEVSIHTISEGIMISKNTDAINLAMRLRFDLVSTIARYSFFLFLINKKKLEAETCEILFLFKEWLSNYDFYGLFENVGRRQKQINISLWESIQRKDQSKELKSILSRSTVNIPGEYREILMDKYGIPVVIDGNQYFKVKIAAAPLLKEGRKISVFRSQSRHKMKKSC